MTTSSPDAEIATGASGEVNEPAVSRGDRLNGDVLTSAAIEQDADSVALGLVGHALQRLDPVPPGELVEGRAGSAGRGAKLEDGSHGGDPRGARLSAGVRQKVAVA